MADERLKRSIISAYNGGPTTEPNNSTTNIYDNIDAHVYGGDGGGGGGGSTGGTTPPTGGSGSGNVTENPYDLLKQQNYEALLAKEIQLENARMRALKSTNASLGALGMQSSGYGQTAMNSIEGQYLSALEQSNKNYQDTENQLAIEEKDYIDARFNNFLNELASYDMSTEESKNKILSNYGLLNTDGSINKEAFEKQYGANNWGAFVSTLDQLESGATEGNGELNLEEQIKSENAKHVQDELNFLTSNTGLQISKNFREGDCIKLSDNIKDKHNVYYMYKGGNLVEITAEQYNAAKSKYWVRSLENSKDMKVDFNGKTIIDQSMGTMTNLSNTAGIISTVIGALTGNPFAIAAGWGAAKGTDYLTTNKYRNQIAANYQEYLKLLGL